VVSGDAGKIRVEWRITQPITSPFCLSALFQLAMISGSWWQSYMECSMTMYAVDITSAEITNFFDEWGTKEKHLQRARMICTEKKFTIG
jgi:hypothetical protein